MAYKTYAQLSVASDVQDGDLLATYRSTGPLKSVLASVLYTYLTGKFGTAAQQNVAFFCQTANNLSDVNAATARTNLGAAPLNAPSFTGGAGIAGGLTISSGGATQTGSTKQNVTAVSALNLDLSTADFFTKSISTNSTFTFSNATASTAQAFILELTISSGAVPTWPASVQWSGGVVPTLGNGRHLIGFVTTNGGTVWTGIRAVVNAS